MGSFRSKEDDVSKISTSIFVTNFPDSFSAKDLFHSCKQYGHVVDSFIPTKRTKDGKRFGFVRFINVFNVERLVNNLCTIWVGRSKFHANVARFKREYMKGSVNVDKTKNESNKRKFDGSHKNVENTVIGKSFVSVVKTSRMPIDKESPPAIVLEDDCLNAKDLTLSLMGRVKEMASLVNLKKALVMKVPTFKRIAAKWGELLDVEDYERCSSEVLGWTPEFSEEEEKDELSVEDNNDGRINDLEANNGKLKFLKDRIRRAASLFIGSNFARFDKPSVNRACIDTPFPVSLSIDQKEDMERRISKEEVKRAVWDCGVDKSPSGCRPVNVGRTKAEFDALIYDIVSLEPEKLVDSNTCIWSISHDDKFSVNSVRKHIDELSLPSLSPMPTLSSLVTQLLLFGISFVFGQVLCSLPIPLVASGIFGFSHGTPQRKRRTALTPSLLLPVGPYGGLEIISLSTLIL
ncbi:nucleotide-binding alpha-beta plait domain-containing protein [Tanacetum coccineum]